MNARVAHLLADYFRRTLGVWALLVLAELLQTSVFWAAQIYRAPLLGAVIVSLVYYAALNSPEAVIRTLPLSRRDVGLFRWWAAIGAPGLIILACTLVAAVTNTEHGWLVPSGAGVVMTAGFSLAVLGWLAVLPLPAMGGSGRTKSRFALVWGALTVAAMYGAPLEGLLRGVMVALMAVGVGAGVWLLVRATGRGRVAAAGGEWSAVARGAWGARRGAPVEAPARGVGIARVGRVADIGIADIGGPVTRPAARARLTGWPLLGLEVARSTACLSVVAFLAISVVRACVTPWFLSAFEPALIWMFASAVAVAGGLLTRRWMLTVRSLRLLPISDHRLAFILYLILITPGVVTCLVMMATRQLLPGWGLDIPGYMLVVFMLTPAASVPWQKQHSAAASASASAIQQWSLVIQQAAFPLWAGALCAFRGPHLQPGWFVGLLALFGAGVSLGGYAGLLAGIRSPQALEV